MTQKTLGINEMISLRGEMGDLIVHLLAPFTHSRPDTCSTRALCCSHLLAHSAHLLAPKLSASHSAHTHTLSHPRTLSLTHTLSHTHSLSHTLSLSHTHSLSHTLYLSHTHSLSLKFSLYHTHHGAVVRLWYY